MSINFATLRSLSIPEGVVTRIEKDGLILWHLESTDSAYDVDFENGVLYIKSAPATLNNTTLEVR